MSNKQKEVHKTWCNYMVEKANSKRVYTVKIESINKGIKSNGMTRNELILALAE